MTPVFLLLLFFSMSAMAAGEQTKDLSEIISQANDGSPNLMDGDIVQSPQRNAAMCTYYGCKWPKRGRYVIVPVVISSRFSRSERSTIIRSLVSFHRSTCIRFVWRRHWWQRNYISFYSGPGCFSNIGRKGGRQYISLKKNSCVVNHVVQHEVLHALGFHHEHKRTDRDKYVRINWQNIKPEQKHNFKRVRTNNLWTGYDFNSVMHYGKYFFSKNGKPTIVAKNPYRTFGHARSMSYSDILRVNRLYRC